jgi:hypothetical protein
MKIVNAIARCRLVEIQRRRARLPTTGRAPVER